MFAAIEAGGTKFVCGVGTGPADLTTIQILTTSPEATIRQALEFIRENAGGRLRAAGVASFGPVDLRRGSATYGYITSTPKPGWANCDLAGAVARGLNVPAGFDTDVNGAALGEARWGAGRGIDDFVYLTAGTGIGGGALVHGRIVHGLMHPEMGHIRVPHDRARDPFPGCCPFHGDCLEGLASGPAIEARWGVAARELPPGHDAWPLEAHYLALGLATWVCSLSPRRFVMGGGVMEQRHLFPLIRAEVARILNGYIRVDEILQSREDFIVPAELGSRAGVLGALVLAEEAAG